MEELTAEREALKETVADLNKHVNSLNQQMGDIETKVQEKVQV